MKIRFLLLFLTAWVLVPAAALAYPTFFQTGTTVNLEGASEGYVIFGGQDKDIHLVDMNGNEVHSWSPQCGWAGPTRPLPGGNILTFTCGSAVELDWDGNIVWQFTPRSDDEAFHHDLDRLPDGNTLILARQTVTAPEISPIDSTEDFLLEVTPSGDIVWEWHQVDHFDEFGFNQEHLDRIAFYGGDWSHGNTVSAIPPNTSHADPRFRPGNVILSMRHQNTIAIIDRSTNEVVWTSIDQTIGAHDTHMLPDDVPGGGNILVFDNGFAAGWAYPRNFSRVVEIDPVTKTIVYDYDASDSGLARWLFYASFTGGTSRLANGNTLIAEGNTGRIFEVLPTGERVWEYVSPYKAANEANVIYRAYKVPYEWASANFSADLVVGGSADADPAQAGAALIYTVQIDNVGQDPAVGPQVSGSTPAGTTFRSLTAPTGWSCSTPAVGSSGSFTCSGSELSAGAAESLALEVDVDFCAKSDTPLTTALTVSSDSDEATPADNTSTIETSVLEVQCSTSTSCTFGACDEASQSCVQQPVENGTLCDDDDATTCDDVCASGVCGGTFVEAPPTVNDSLRLDKADGTTTVNWSDEPGNFNAYEGTIVVGAPYTYNHACLTTDGPTSESSVPTASEPELGSTLYYLVTRVEQCRESVSGYDSAGSPRVDGDSCLP